MLDSNIFEPSVVVLLNVVVSFSVVVVIFVVVISSEVVISSIVVVVEYTGEVLVEEGARKV